MSTDSSPLLLHFFFILPSEEEKEMAIPIFSVIFSQS